MKLLSLIVLTLGCLGQISETIPRALTTVTEHNFERILRETDEDWFFVVSTPKRDHYELNMLA